MSTEKEIKTCDECGSMYYAISSKMLSLCPECASILYGYENCKHVFKNGRCISCYWDGSRSVYSYDENGEFYQIRDPKEVKKSMEEFWNHMRQNSERRF